MKKNRIMRLASAMLVLTLVTTCAISNTFAKYTTKTEGSDSARVAYWGFSAPASTTIKLFDTSYNGGTSNSTVTVKSASADATEGQIKENVIAPGTANSTEFGFAYTGNAGKGIAAPEVAYTLKIDATATGSYSNLDSNPNFKWTLKSGKTGETETEYDTVAQLLAAIKKLSGATGDDGIATYQPGALPEAFGTADSNAKCTVGWKWDFETESNATVGQDVDGAAAKTPEEQDTTDTNMGNATTLDNVAITITITATQID